MTMGRRQGHEQGYGPIMVELQVMYQRAQWGNGVMIATILAVAAPYNYHTVLHLTVYRSAH